VLIPDDLIQVSLCLFLKELIYKILVSTSCIDTTIFYSDFAIKILYARFISSAFSPAPTYLMLCYLINLIEFCEVYTLWTSNLFNFFHCYNSVLFFSPSHVPFCTSFADIKNTCFLVPGTKKIPKHVKDEVSSYMQINLCSIHSL